MGTKGVVIFMLLLCLPSAWGATIYGNVYDLSLSKVSGAVVEVNTTPQQKLVAQDGRYAFEIPKGTYRISAELGANGHVTARENQTVTVLQEGSYVIDLILFPVIDEGELADPGLGELGDLGPSGKGYWAVAIIVVIGLAIGGGRYYMYNTRAGKGSRARHEEAQDGRTEGRKDDDDAGKLLSIIKRHGGRATQKELRKEMPFSEAKISLLLAELEHRKKIEKIRKGRGNIIVLKG
ncbi:TPA: hypothetical protein HA228_00740 [Candidatus Woesearchaeota archaeon]|nr:hypothetical protein [Candidatus Woesearchaeota archaeon]HII64113.1 hypothetical protein [Candidatus Woesearchaeota archaeon]